MPVASYCPHSLQYTIGVLLIDCNQLLYFDIILEDCIILHLRIKSLTKNCNNESQFSQCWKLIRGLGILLSVCMYICCKYVEKLQSDF